MRRVEEIALELNLITKADFDNNAVYKLSSERLNDIYNKSYCKLVEETSESECCYLSRDVDRQYTTVFNRMSKKQKLMDC